MKLVLLAVSVVLALAACEEKNTERPAEVDPDLSACCPADSEFQFGACEVDTCTCDYGDECMGGVSVECQSGTWVEIAHTDPGLCADTGDVGDLGDVPVGDPDASDMSVNDGGGDTNMPDVAPDLAVDMPGADADASPDTADMNAARLEEHGCTYAGSVDRTGMSTVVLTDMQAWSLGHNLCVRVTDGTLVRMMGAFDVHPLRGGVAPFPDAANPFQINGEPVTTNATIEFTVTSGDYPYFCDAHPTTMRAVLYVDP